MRFVGGVSGLESCCGVMMYGAHDECLDVCRLGRPMVEKKGPRFIKLERSASSCGGSFRTV